MRIIKEISRGGFGRVEQLETDSGGMVARKVYDPQPGILASSNEEKLKKRFRREVKVQSSLSGHSFLPILEYDLDCDYPWFTMPLAERNFEEEIAISKRDGTALTEQLAEILNALEELHSIGFTHRDLKPQNILLHLGMWKLSDFGLVLPVISATSALTSTGSSWGSVPYCAPEQALDFKHATQQVDIYAFGAILHDIYGVGPGGRVPYKQQTCDGPIGAIIERCTAYTPDKRFKSISVLRGALLTILSIPSVWHSSPTGSDWVVKLANISTWDGDTILAFNRFLTREASDLDKGAVCVELNEAQLKAIHSLDVDLWHTIAQMYCEWAKGSFEFSYCDVIIGRIEYIFGLGDLECRATAAIAAAELGVNHNRWYVMGRLLSMCTPRISNTLADRIAIEILAEEAQSNFRRCAEGINQTIKNYHPRIVKVLKTRQAGDARTSTIS